MFDLVLSDIHGNYEALSAVFDFCKIFPLSHIYLLGDIIDYGADSVKCINYLYKIYNEERIEVRGVVGNHEEYFNQPSDKLITTTHGRQNAVITARDLSDIETQFKLMQLTRYETYEDQIQGTINIKFYHYQDIHHSLITDENFLSIGQYYEGSGRIVNFVGHTHLQGYYKENNNLFINPGSVGQPRNGDPRSQFILIDRESLQIIFCRLPYDYELASKRIRDSGRPGFLADRILFGV